MKGYVYILKCSDGSFYTGSTKDIEIRLRQHQSGFGSNHTRKDCLLSWFFLKNFKILQKHISVRSKFRAGIEKRK